MRRLITGLVFVLTACGGGGGPSSAPASEPPAAVATALPIQSGQFSLLGPIFNGGGVAEATYYPNGSSYGLFFGCGDQKTCFIPDFVASPTQSPNRTTTADNCRFPYAFQDQGAHYLVCGNAQPGDGDVYLYCSTDLVTWTIQNGGQPIVRRTPGTHWAHIWNVAILPVAGRWHMLAESHSDTTRMDIAYAWADPAVSLDFTPNQGPVVIPNGGNPEMFLKNGKMVALHGLYHDRSPTDPWYTTMSTADPASPTAWTIRRDKLLIEQPGIDVCDPTYIEVNGEALIAVSYDQTKVVQIRGPTLNP